MNHVALFESQNLRITPVDLDKDPQVIADWTCDLDIARKLRDDQPARPMPVFEVKRLGEQWQKDVDSGKQYVFAIRRVSDNQVIGVTRICYITWVHGAAFLDLIIGEPADHQAYAREALDLALCYAFDELNLFRVTVVVAGHDEVAHELYRQANFTLEVRQRQAIYWQKQAWDKLYFGLLRPEWKMQREGALA
jgi:RimJ/RimL family protein N-acetyltransferase